MRIPKTGLGLSARLSNWEPDPSLYFSLVRALYSTPKSMIGATVTALAMITVAFDLTSDWVFLLLFGGFLAVGSARITANTLYGRGQHDPDDLASVRRWELLALCGAWAFSILVGLAGAYTVLAHPGTQAEILINCCVIGYIAGISSRNASRPVITIGQITATCLPFSIGLICAGDLVHLTLAAFIIALHVSTIVISRTVYDTIISRHHAQNKIEKLALRDFLTDLWNRSAFLDMLGKTLAASTDKKLVGLISIDLDRFKDINDTLGHPVGDAVLRATAERIKAVVDPSSEIARFGGDEFLVMVTVNHPSEIETVAHRLIEKLHQRLQVGMTSTNCGASIGTALAPAGGISIDDFMRHVDLALYAAKRAGGGAIVHYTSDLSRQYDEYIVLMQDLQEALVRDELDLVYQPIVEPRSGRAICCEALLRWDHPRRGRISPSVFVPIAESTGMIVRIGAWVLRTACAEAAHWPGDVKVAINLSPVQFRRGCELVDTVMRILEETGLPAHRLELEVTENVLIEDTAETLFVIEELRRKGIGVSLDDFGTGFSSLSYLHDFPFSKIKIDRKFTQNLAHSKRAMAIVRGIAQITRDLGIELVAEGVETENQLLLMRQFGINAIQGYIFSQPLSAHRLRFAIRQPLVISAVAVTAETGGAEPGQTAA